MRSRFPVLATLLAVVAGGPAASAQDGLRSAALPERAPSVVRPETDLFAVGPDFYRRTPDPGREPPLMILPYAWPAPYWYPPPADISRLSRARNRKPVARPAVFPAAATPGVSQPPPAQGPAKTFYVIPKCYAGDRRPAPERLPAGCDMSRLTVVPPR